MDEDTKNTILVELGENDDAGLSDLVDRVAISRVRTEYYLELLEAEGLVESAGRRFWLTHEGRAYVVDNDLDL